MTQTTLEPNEGSCHCGAIGYVYRASSAPADWPYRACQCSFCRAHDVISTSDPNGSLEISLSQPDRLQRYRFGLQTADFLLCRDCGVYIGALIATDAGAFGIVNLRALNRPVSYPEDIAAADYGRETEALRIARRTARWTPVRSLPG